MALADAKVSADGSQICFSNKGKKKKCYARKKRKLPSHVENVTVNGHRMQLECKRVQIKRGKRGHKKATGCSQLLCNTGRGSVVLKGKSGTKRRISVESKWQFIANTRSCSRRGDSSESIARSESARYARRGKRRAKRGKK